MGVMDATVAMVIGNRDDADLGVLGEWADGRGIELRTVDREDDRLPSLDGCSLVVSLGSVWRVHDPALEPVLQPEQELLRRAVAGGTPVLAICFGMQQLTVAFGGEVYATDQPEIGFTFVEPRVPAIPRGPWMEYHYDACHLPPGAVALAANAARPPGLPAGLGAGRPVPPRGRPGGGQALVGRERGRARGPRAVRGLDGRGRGASTPTTARVAALALFDGFWSRR